VTNYGALMSACGACGDAGGIRGLISDMRKRKLTPDDASYNVLIRCLYDAGRVDEAHRELVEMLLKDGTALSVATYRVLLDGCCEAGDFDLGLRVFNAMLAGGHCPMAPTFRRLVRGLGEDSKAEEACFVLEQMGQRGMRLDAQGWQSVASCVCSSINTTETNLVDHLVSSS
jgi:pentatricopeptide repeat protein